MARLAVSGLTLIPPGHARPVLRAVSFTLSPGEAIGVIGPTGSGKTSLARALTCQWPTVAGDIRLDGAIITQYPPQTRAHYIGYLSQRPILFPGTIGENIARLCPDPDPDSIIAAATRADAHDMILSLPKGYDMMVTADMIAQDLQLSGGQIQRIGLARALFGDPAIVILDEPNANLDHHGTVALNAALRHLKSQGRAAIIMAHRPAAIRECDRLLMLDDGVPVALGPRDDVLKQVARNPHVLRPNGDPFRDDLNGGLA